MQEQASLRATAKQSSTIEDHAKHFSATAYVSMLAAELKLLAMFLLYWIASRLLAMTDFLYLYADSLNNIWTINDFTYTLNDKNHL